MYPADIARIAHEERDRRYAAWRAMIAAKPADQRAALQERADIDHDLWLDIEYWAMRYAGDPEGRAHGWPRSLAAGLASVGTTITAAQAQIDAGKLAPAKGDDLAHLRRWLTAHMPVRLSALT
ncbi:hypothetical protein BH10PSE12_BH10PSE12_03120 [soil metagenome]